VKTRREELVADGLDRVGDVAHFLSLSRSQIYALMAEGTLAFVKLGRSRRIPHRAVVELAEQHLVVPEAR
jgi:excisionase family DNA binding protein